MPMLTSHILTLILPSFIVIDIKTDISTLHSLHFIKSKDEKSIISGTEMSETLIGWEVKA